MKSVDRRHIFLNVQVYTGNGIYGKCTLLFDRISDNSGFDNSFGSEERILFHLNLMPLSYQTDVVKTLNKYRSTAKI